METQLIDIQRQLIKNLEDIIAIQKEIIKDKNKIIELQKTVIDISDNLTTETVKLAMVPSMN